MFLTFRVLNEIFSKADEHVEKGDLTVEFQMGALPSLYEQFVQLIEYLVLKIAHTFLVASIFGLS